VERVAAASREWAVCYSQAKTQGKRRALTTSCLIGHTGFIGGNLARQTAFTDFYNSKNIAEIEGRDFGLMVVSGVTATKWWANQNAGEDRQRIDSLLGNLSKVKADRVFVISTVDVYPVTRGVDESFDCHAAANHAYGVNRLYFEDEMKRMFPEARIVRIGGVFGHGLKKNLIYDLLHDNGVEKINLGSSFQFYDVGGLWADLVRMEDQGLSLVNLLTEPVTMREIVERVWPGKAVGTEPGPLAAYDVRTKYAAEMGGAGGYLTSKAQVLDGLEKFVAAETAGAGV
jgi:nucleoside-diphosphate-sugar epimerase